MLGGASMTRGVPERWRNPPAATLVSAATPDRPPLTTRRANVHEGRVAIQTLDDGALRFLKADGQSFDSGTPDRTRPVSDWRQLSATHRQQGIHINEVRVLLLPTAHLPRRRLDWHTCGVDALLHLASMKHVVVSLRRVAMHLRPFQPAFFSISIT